MKKIHSFIIIVLILFSYSCKTGKNFTEKNITKPDWVISKPQSSLFYTGVSSAPKKGYSPGEYIQNAQQKALADLSSGISVNIESTSILSIIEDNYKINENFSSEIIASTNQVLEDYELVDAWEDDNHYWVYYRLSKNLYQDQINRKKQQVIMEAKNKYYQANELLNKNSHYNAFQFYTDALASLKPYLGQSTVTEINGTNKDLGILLFNAIADFVNNIKFEFPKPEVTVKKGLELNPDTFSFSIIDINNSPMSNIPLKINFSGSGLLRTSEVSDINGRVFCSLRKIKSPPNIETLTVVVDMVTLSRVAKDPLIRNIIKSIPAAENKFRVIVEKPSLFIYSNEKVFNTVKNSNKFESVFKSLLNSDFIISDNNDADFILNISSNIIKNGERYGESLVTINYTFELINKHGNTVYRKSTSNDFTSSNYENASEKAYNEISKTIERSIARDIITALNK